MWLLILIFFCIIAANSSLTFFGPSVVKEVGFTNPATVGWIMALSYLCGAVGMICNGLHSDRSKEARLHCAFAAALGALGLAAAPRSSCKHEPDARAGRADAGHRRHDERDPGVLATAGPLPGRRGGGGRRGADQLDRQPRRLRRAVRCWASSRRRPAGSRRACYIVAAVEVCAAVLILLFVPRFAKKAVTR